MSAVENYKASIEAAAKAVDKALEMYTAAVQELVDKHGYCLATGHMSDFWQVRRPRGKSWKHEYDYPTGKAPEIFAELAELEKLGEDFRIGPTNMVMFKPRKVSNSK